MLIYVDKKKEKKQKIKIISFVLISIFILWTNIIYFSSALNQAINHLTNYKSITHANHWYKNAQIVYLFNAPKPDIKKIIIIPKTLNRETITIIASILSKLKRQQTYQILTDISDKDLLTRLIEKVAPQLNVSDNFPDVIITSDFSNVTETIAQNKMVPLTLNYKTAEKKLSLGKISKYINTFFPLKATPANQLEEEKQALEIFMEDNFLTLKEITTQGYTLHFSKQSLFLQNVRLCLINQNSDFFCGLSNHASLLHNLKKSLSKMPKDSPIKKIILLTSDTPFNPQNMIELQKDEGLHFQYQKREAILLPEEISSLTNSQQILYKLKSKAGINPQYEHHFMKYYKFKTLEVNLDDKI